ncbi:MAG: glycosyltransferase family 4 protein, partial [Verrucomicrobiota bacterium]
MKIIQITPGAGGMYCGNCFRDNQLVAEFRRQGHDVLMVPLYLPMTLDEEDQSSGIPVFFGGINVYLQQKVPLMGKMPDWLHRKLSSPPVLKWASGKTAKTRASELGDLTLSMIRGEEGRQARELNELIAYLRTHEKPDVICLSNALLVGMVRSLRRELKTPVACVLQGEDSFLDSLPEPQRQQVWSELAERCREVDLFIAPSRYFGELMGKRLNLPPEKVQTVYNGIKLEGYSPAISRQDPPVIGYFARMCVEKGLPIVVDAFLHLKRRNSIPNLKLHIGGGLGPSDEPLVNEVKKRLEEENVFGDVTFFPNVTKEQKQQFFKRISVMSVPALYGEAFGLYLLEAWASGVPVAQPPVAAFPELIEASGAGVVAKDSKAESLADALEKLLLDEPTRTAMGIQARKAVEEQFNASIMAQNMISKFESISS